MSVYLVRHGETDWNSLFLAQGWHDVPLNAKGIEEAEAAREKMKDVHLDLVFSSPLVRARKTAEIIVEPHHLPIAYDDRLKEMNFGDYEGKDRSLPEIMKIWHSFTLHFPHGESGLEVASRIYSFLDELKEKHGKEDILLVTHGGASRYINAYFHDLTMEEFLSFRIGNCKIRRYEFAD